MKKKATDQQIYKWAGKRMSKSYRKTERLWSKEMRRIIKELLFEKR